VLKGKMVQLENKVMMDFKGNKEKPALKVRLVHMAFKGNRVIRVLKESKEPLVKLVLKEPLVRKVPLEQ
jgi:hypothetical protein